MEFEWQVPQDTDDGWHEFILIADYYENNTEDNNLSNNRDTHEICIGDCTLPDLTWLEQGLDSITIRPPEAVAGERSEELRVGTACRSRWSPYPSKTNSYL